ncbi:MAG: NAD(P)/FAD-dependent oxidoreductase [Candidatus Thorarchaeota archaeon]|nr:MAG: NAD(P)/FAD-dependent oxidoreductase [Candidatus Thorarchaeota archaeon]
MSYDIIVVGAGPAGSIAAQRSAALGLRTLLLEKHSLPREKACGGAVMHRGLQIVNERIPRRVVEQKIYGLRFVLQDGRTAEFESDKLLGITCHRSVFDEYLARRAERAGADLIEQARVVDASVNDDYAETTLSDGRVLRARFLIGADGVTSTVAHSLGLRPKKNSPTRLGLGMESDFYLGEDGVLEATNGNPHILDIIPIQGRISYGWVFPKREYLAIGVAGAAPHMLRLRQIFDSFVRRMQRRLRSTLTPSRRRTWYLAGQGLEHENVTTRGILIGDAAGFVDPLMGEGIAYAMKSAVHATDVIASAIDSGRHDPKFLSKYNRLCRKDFKASFAFAQWAGINGFSYSDFILSHAEGQSISSEILAQLARGEIGYSDIPAAVIKRLPREIPVIVQKIVLTRMNNVPRKHS